MSKRVFKYSLYGRPIDCYEQLFDDDELALWFKKLKKEFIGFSQELTEKIKFSDPVDKEQYQELCHAFRTLRHSLQGLIRNKSRNLSAIDFEDIRDKICYFNNQLHQIKSLIEDKLFSSRLQKFALQIQAILFKITNAFFARDLQYSRTTSNFLHLSPVMYECTEEGPAMHSIPRYILPDRPSISLFFSQQIAHEINKIEQRHVITVP